MAVVVVVVTVVLWLVVIVAVLAVVVTLIIVRNLYRRDYRCRSQRPRDRSSYLSQRIRWRFSQWGRTLFFSGFGFGPQIVPYSDVPRYPSYGPTCPPTCKTAERESQRLISETVRC